MTNKKTTNFSASSLVSSCCHDLATPLTATMLAFDSLEIDDSEKEIADLVKINFQKISLLLNSWRNIFGSSQSFNFSTSLEILKKIGSFNKVSISYNALDTSLLEKNYNKKFLKTLCAILYFIASKSLPEQTIKIENAENISITADAVSSLESLNKEDSSLSGIEFFIKDNLTSLKLYPLFNGKTVTLKHL